MCFPAVAFLIGLWLGSYLQFFPLSIFVLISVVGVSLTCLEIANRLEPQQGLVFFSCFVFGVVYWSAADWIQNQSDLHKWMGPQPITVTGSVDQPVRRALDRDSMVIEVTSITEGHRSVPASGTLFLIWRKPNRAFSQGDTLKVSTRIRPPFGTHNPGGFDYGNYLKRKGIHAVASVFGPDQVQLVEPNHSFNWNGFWRFIDKWRYQIQRAAVHTLQGSAIGLFLGMVIGEQGFIPQEIRDAFMVTGTVHIISISGSHLGLIAFLTFFLIKGMMLRLPASWLDWISLRLTATRLAILATLPLVSFYTFLAGAEIATVRSWIMIILFLLAVWVGHERNILRVLVLAAVIVLLHHPQALFDISFQLSYMAVLAIALMLIVIQACDQEGEVKHQVKNTLSQRMFKWMANTWWLSLGVTVATVPIVAYHFNQIAWMGLFANFLVVPYVGFVVVPLGLISAVLVLLAGSDLLPFATLNQYALDGLTVMVQWLAMAPFAEWHVASPGIMGILVFYGFLITAVVFNNRYYLRSICTVSSLVILLFWIWSPRLGLDPETVRVSFLDVGQGDATVIELPDSQTVLIDAGASYSRLDMGQAVVGPFLWDQGIRRIDHIIATHPQWDHMGGLSWLLKKFSVGQYWSNGVTRENMFYQRVQKALQEVGLSENVTWKGQEITRGGGCRLKVLNPSSRPSVRASSSRGRDLNNQSIITRLDCGLHSFLLTADAEREALWHILQSPEGRTAQIVKVPHHGAKSSLNHAWIKGLNAEAAVISVGRRNRYGHPKPAVLKAYREQGFPIYRTDRDGAVWVTASLTSGQWSIQAAQNGKLKPIDVLDYDIGTEMKNWVKLWANGI